MDNVYGAKVEMSESERIGFVMNMLKIMIVV